MARRSLPDLPPPRPQVMTLLQEAKESDKDYTPHLILADWLEEHGSESDQARAELLRVSCRLVCLPWNDPTRKELSERVDALVQAHGDDWFGPLRWLDEKYRGCRMHAGLVELHTTAPRAQPSPG